MNIPCCGGFLFPMQCDVYYAIESQNKYGKIEKDWQLDGSRSCSLYAPDDNTNDNNFQYDDKKFYRMETTLYGRFKQDIRIGLDGQYHPLSHVLVTNIRGNDGVYFYETNGNYVGKPTVYEISMVQPAIGPFGKVDYFKIVANRSDTQELNDLVAC